MERPETHIDDAERTEQTPNGSETASANAASADAPASADSAPQDGVAVLTAQIEALQKKAEEYRETAQRALADYSNLQKRQERESKESYQNAANSVMKSLLPIIDDFERALANVPADLQGNAWVNGTSAIMRKFEKLLSDYNVTVIDPKGEVFDPSLHEAIGQDDAGDAESGRITAVMLRGYKVGDRVLRTALVRVAR